MKTNCLRVGCHKRFEKTVPWKKYCSDTCKLIAWALRQANKKKKKTKVIFE